jgi:hypothetical protein
MCCLHFTKQEEGEQVELFDQRIQTETTFDHKVVTISWSDLDFDGEKEFKLSGLLLTPTSAFVISDGNIEFHVVEKNQPEIYPVVLQDLTTLSVIEFVRTYTPYELMGKG